MYHSDSVAAPTPTSSELSSELHRLNEVLVGLDPRPSPETNTTFERLVRLCTSVDEHTARQVLATPRIGGLLRSLREVSARGETELERHWATEVSRAEDPWATLRSFPYLDNYRDLVRVELGASAAAGAPGPRSVAVLGAGPLPLTGLLLAHDHRVQVVNVDCSAHACSLGADVTTALSLSDRVSTVWAEAAQAAHLEEVENADLVVLAALVGEDGAGKRPTLRALARVMRPHATLLVRSAHHLRTALYPRVSPDDLDGFRPLLEVNPCDEVVNSVLVARPQ